MMPSLKADVFNDLIIDELVKFDDEIAEAVSQLTENIFSGAMFTVAKDILTVIKPIALTIIGICFIVEFIRITMTLDILKWEYAAKAFVKLILSKVILDVAPTAFEAIYLTASQWVTSVGSIQSKLGVTAQTTAQHMSSNLDFMDQILMGSVVTIIFLGVSIIGLIIHCTAVARQFELLAYLAVAPIPCAFFPLEGSNRITKKFFLSFAAVSMQGVFLVLILKLFTTFISDKLNAVTSSTDMLELGMKLLFAALVLMICVNKSGSWARSLLDAN
jgi:hypothetical protein